MAPRRYRPRPIRLAPTDSPSANRPSAVALWATAAELERKREGVVVAGVDEDSVLQNIPTDETLYVLPMERRADSDSLNDHVVPGHDQPDKVLVTRHAGGRWRVDIADTDRLKTQPLGNVVVDDRARSTGVYHRDSNHRVLRFLATLGHCVLGVLADGHTDLQDRALLMEACELNSQ
jgi:hypothetical protein